MFALEKAALAQLTVTSVFWPGCPLVDPLGPLGCRRGVFDLDRCFCMPPRPFHWDLGLELHGERLCRRFVDPPEAC